MASVDNYATATANFDVTITSDCSSTVITASSVLDVYYTVGEDFSMIID